MDCRNCGFTNIEGIANCISCDFPLQENKDKINSYNKKVAGISFNYKYLSTNYLNTILILAVFFLVATIITLSYKIIYGDSNFFPLMVLSFISALYLIIYSLGRKTNEFLYLSRFALLFYIIHTVIEVATNIYPKAIPFASAISMKASLYSSGFYFLPYFYFSIRIAILYFFVRGLLSALKLHKEKRALQYYLSIATHTNKKLV